MTTFLHTADWQLGMRAKGLGDAAATVRDRRFDTVAAILELAEEQKVDFVLVAGDTFEDNGVSNDTIYRATQALEKAGTIPVYVIPGNHDPFTADSIYNRPAWTSSVPENVTVLTEREPVVLEEHDVVLFPCPLSQKQSREDPTAWIVDDDTDAGDAIRVGLAHGSLDIHGKDFNFPVAPDSAGRGELDYLALGDWHRKYVHDAHTAYSGTPEQTDFGEQDTGHVLIVEIPEKGGDPTIEEHQVGQLNWLKWDHDLAQDPPDELRHRIQELDGPEDTLLRLTLRGAIGQEMLSELDGLREFTTSRLLYFDSDEEALGLVLGTEDIREILPPGTLRQTAEVLLALRTGDDVEEGITVEGAAEALENLPDGVDTDEQVVERALQILCGLGQKNK